MVAEGRVESFWDDTIEQEYKALMTKLSTKDAEGRHICDERDLKRMAGLMAMSRYYLYEQWKLKMYQQRLEAGKAAAAAKKEDTPEFTSNLQKFFLDFRVSQNAAAPQQDKKKAEERLEIFPWSDLTRQFTNQMECSMLDTIKKQVSKQLVSYSIRKDRRLDEYEDLVFGPNDQSVFDEKKIAEYVQKRYYHDETDNCMTLMDLIGAHIHFTKLWSLTERAAYDIFKRFTRRNNTRLGFLVDVAQRSRKPYKLFYEQLLVEFDASHTDVNPC